MLKRFEILQYVCLQIKRQLFDKLPFPGNSAPGKRNKRLYNGAIRLMFRYIARNTLVYIF